MNTATEGLSKEKADESNLVGNRLASSDSPMQKTPPQSFSPYSHVTPDVAIHGEGPFVAALPAQPRASRATTQLDQLPMWHSDAAKVGALYNTDSVFVKHRKDGSISLIYEQQLRQRGVHGYTFTILDGHISPSDGVGFVFADRVPCSKNIKRLWSVFANRTGHIVKRMGNQMERHDHPQLPPLALGCRLSIVLDLDQYCAVFECTGRNGTVLARSKLDLADMAERVDGSRGYLCAAITKAGMVVRLEKAAAELLNEPEVAYVGDRNTACLSTATPFTRGYPHRSTGVPRGYQWRPYTGGSRASNGSAPPYSRFSTPPGFSVNYPNVSNRHYGAPRYPNQYYDAAASQSNRKQHSIRTANAASHDPSADQPVFPRDGYAHRVNYGEQSYVSQDDIMDRTASWSSRLPPEFYSKLQPDFPLADVFGFPTSSGPTSSGLPGPSSAEEELLLSMMRQPMTPERTLSNNIVPSDGSRAFKELDITSSADHIHSSSHGLGQSSLFRTTSNRSSTKVDPSSVAAWTALWKRLPPDESALMGPTLSLNNRGISVSSNSSQYVGVPETPTETSVLLEQLRYWLQQGLVDKKQLLEAIEPGFAEPLPMERTTTVLQPAVDNNDDDEDVSSNSSKIDTNAPLLDIDNRTVSAPPAPVKPPQFGSLLSES